MFPNDFCKVFKNNFLIEHHSVSASVVRWIASHRKLKLNVTRHSVVQLLEQEIDLMTVLIF